MKEISNILVPVDFSNCSKNALEYACSIAKQYNAKVHALSVTQMIAMATEYGMAVDFSDRITETKTSLKELVEQISHQFNAIEIDQTVIDGDVVDSIVDYTASNPIDLIIMGTEGAEGGIEKIFGSNSSYVMSSASCPVLVIPSEYKYDAINAVVLAYDYKDVLTHKELDVLCSMLSTFSAQLEVLKVVVNEKEVTPEEAEAVKNIDDYLHDAKVDFKYGHVMCKDIFSGLNQHVTKYHADILVVMPQKHNLLESLFHKSVSKELVFKPQVPVLVLHEEIAK
jgi:nucleotide-binding universal stress UspA family protein